MADDFVSVDLEKIEKDLDRWVKRGSKLIGKDMVSKGILGKLGKEVSNRIRLRTRLGWGVPANGAKRVKLKSMREHSDAYADWRQEHPGALSGDTAPGKHNLTLTGDMLNDLTVVQIDLNNRKIKLGFKTKFSLKKAQINTDRGWIFMHLSDTEIKSVSNFYKREVRKLVKQFNNG